MTLLGFQDKGIFEILYNKEYKLILLMSEPIELQQSWKTQGISYISKNSGTLNKWTIKESSKGYTGWINWIRLLTCLVKVLLIFLNKQVLNHGL